MTSSSVHLSSQLLVGELVKRASHQSPNAEAYVFAGTRRTFQEMDDTITQLAGWLQKQGLRQDDKVGFMLKNSLAFAEVAMGIPLSGAVGVPINFRFGPNEVEYIVNNSDARMVFIDAEYVDMMESVQAHLPQVETIVVVGAEKSLPKGFINYAAIFQSEAVYEPPETLTDDHAAYIMYTSGTTGLPKGAIMTHKNICQNAYNNMYVSKTERYESQLICAPQFHIAGLLLTVQTFMDHGKTVIHRDFNPVDVLDSLEAEKIHTIFLVPSMWNFLFQVPNIGDYDLSSVTLCATGAAITPLPVKKRITHYFPNAKLTDNFGQTETTATATSLTGDDVLRKPESVGKPYPNVEIRIVDENMNDVPRGEVGEIVYRGPTVMKAYYKNAEATEEAFRGGWFHSDDLVRMDEEGFIYVVDRKNNMINSGGENIYPAEIEEVLYQIPDVLECAVIGIPDNIWGERVKAVVAVKPGKTLTENQVIEHCREHLASYKKPTEVEFVDELPRNTSGKVLKYVLQGMK